MSSHVCVTVTGPALSFLIYENVNCYGDQEGFLLGEVINHVTDTISDAQIRGEKTETLISINYLMPVPNTVCFYNGVGRVNREALRDFLKEKSKEVVGWYSFRRNCPLVPYLRDRVLHKELSAALSEISAEHFTMCLLNTSVSNGGSTHVFNHKFMRYRHGKFEAVPMQIHNLGEIQPEYKVVPSSACLSDSFKNIITSLNGQENISDVELVRRIQESLQKHLRILIDDVATSELKVAELEEEVNMLRNQSLPIPNEILLPHLLRDDKEDVGDSSSCSTPIPTPGKSSVNKPSTSVLIPEGVSDSNRLSDGDGADVVMKHAKGDDPSTEPFAYVTEEMKIQMSKPAKDVPSCSKSNIKHEGTGRSPLGATLSSDTGRGNRGRTQQQAPKVFQNNTTRGRENKPAETSPSIHGKQPDPSVNSPSNPRNIPSTPSSAGKRRGNHAQALKRPGNSDSSGYAGTKSTPKAYGTDTNDAKRGGTKSSTKSKRRR